MFLPFFVGTQTIMALYHVVLYFHVKERSYLFYAIHLLSNAGYAIFCWIRVDEDLQSSYPISSDYFYLLALCTTLGMIAYMHFLRSFLSLKKNSPFWDKVFRNYGHLGWIVVLIAGAIFTLHPEPVQPFLITAVLYVLISTLIGLFFIPSLFRLRKKTNYYFIFGFCSLTIFAIISVIARIGGMEYFFIYIELGVLTEAILFSIGLTYQTQQREKKSRQTLVELEMSKSRRNIAQLQVQRQAELSELRKDFYTNLTHEFRTPLTVINGMAEEIVDKVENQSISAMGEMIGRNSQSLLHIVNKILDIEIHNNSTREVRYVKNDLISYLRFIVASFQSMANSKNVGLEIQTSIDHLEMAYDDFRMQQIMYNLISNAIKYSNPGGRIIVRVETLSDDNLEIQVIDNGPGIDQAEQEKVFEKYYQISTHKKKDIPSSGIGLHYTKQLVELLGGEIHLLSEVGRGSTFQLRFPILNEIPASPIPQEYGPTHNHPIEFLNQELEEGKPLLLIAEDNYDVASYLAYILKERYELMISYNGAEAIQMARDHLPDIIISDVMIPEKNGYELCEELKSHPTTSHIPIVLLTGKIDFDSKMEGIEKGADVYLTKPFKKDELLIRLKKLFESRAILQAKYASPHFGDRQINKTEDSEDLFLASIQHLILDNMEDSSLQISDFTSQLKLSHTQLYRKIKALTDLTPTQFIRQVRLDKAMDFLSHSDLTISEIAYKTGYSDPNYFTRIFKKQFNQTPGAFRNNKPKSS